ncbi:unnamed protein product, partial [Amoebophrya sp. A120]
VGREIKVTQEGDRGPLPRRMTIPPIALATRVKTVGEGLTTTPEAGRALRCRMKAATGVKRSHHVPPPGRSARKRARSSS